MQAHEVETQRCFTCNQPGHLQRDHWKYEEKKWEQAPAAEGASPKQVGFREGEGKNPSGRPRHVSNKSPKMKRAPYLNLDAFHRFIGPKNLGKVLVDDELVTCLFVMECSSTSSCLPMLRREWTSCPWTIWPKRSVEPSRTSAA